MQYIAASRTSQMGELVAGKVATFILGAGVHFCDLPFWTVRPIDIESLML